MIIRNVQGFYFRFFRHPQKIMNNENLWNYGIKQFGLESLLSPKLRPPVGTFEHLIPQAVDFPQV